MSQESDERVLAALATIEEGTHRLVVRIAELDAALAEKRDFYETIDLSTFNHAVERAEQAEAELAERDRLVAKYKWQRDECANKLGRKLAGDYKYRSAKPFVAQDVIVDLNHRWDEHNA